MSRDELTSGAPDIVLGALKTFVQGVKEHSWSARWHDPTGRMAEYNNGQPRRTKQPSLPL